MSWENLWWLMALLLWIAMVCILGVNAVVNNHIEKSREDDIKRKAAGL